MKNDNQLKLGVEALECRRMMAGDVSVKVDNGDLVVKGDNANNELMILGTGVDGVFDIIAANGTAVNGQNAISVSGVTDDIRIDLKNGDNSLGVVDVVGTDRLRIRTGKGNDTVVLERSGGKDHLELITGGGDDSIYLYRSGSRKINARTGAGNDEFAIDDCQTQYFTVNMGRGDDEAYLGDTVIVHQAKANMGGGSDSFMFEPSTAFAPELRFSGGAGFDAFGGHAVQYRSFESTGVTVDSLSHFIDLSVGQIESRIDLARPV